MLLSAQRLHVGYRKSVLVRGAVGLEHVLQRIEDPWPGLPTACAGYPAII